MQVMAVKLGTVFSSPSGITETRSPYTVPIMETAVRAVDNYEAKKKFIQLVPASFLGRHGVQGTGGEGAEWKCYVLCTEVLILL